MLKPRQIDELPETLIALYSQVEMDIIANMAARISAMDYFIPAAQWQYQKLLEMGNCHGWIVQALSAQTGKSRKELERLMHEAGQKAIRQDSAIYKRAGLNPPELTASQSLQAVLNDGIRNTAGLFENLSGTTARTASRQFERAVDRAWLQIHSGGFSVEDAIRFAVKDLAQKGVECVAYPSGRVDHMDVAVRRAVVTGVNQTALRLQDELAENLGCDLVETTAHAGARPEHVVWQGKVFSRSGRSSRYPDFRSATGYGTGSGLGGWNCRHSFFPYFEGISDPAYTPEELEDMTAPRYTYRGEELTEYEASQKQRSIERNIRRWKREYKAMEAAGLDTTEASAKLSQWYETQRDFIAQTGLKRQFGRESIPNITLPIPKKRGILSSGSGIVGLDLEIDRFTPCLIEKESGNIVATRYSKATKQELLAVKKRGWKFNWTARDLADAEIFKLTLAASDEIQGLIAITDYPRDSAVYINIAESAPHNLGHEKQYEGVGGHLFAIAAQESTGRGYGGFIFLDAKNTELVDYYKKKFGATLLGRPHIYRMYIDEESAQALLKEYTMEGRD